MIVAFQHTTPALLAGRKTVTRRRWLPQTAAKFRAGQVVDAWDKSPRAKGKHVAWIRLTAAPTLEWSHLAPESDWAAEGFEWMEREGLRLGRLTPRQVWDGWKTQPERLYVVRFELVEKAAEAA